MTQHAQNHDNPWRYSGLLLAAPTIILSAAAISHTHLSHLDHQRIKQGLRDQALDVVVRVDKASAPIPLTHINPQQRETLLGTLKGKNIPGLTLEFRDESGRIGCPVPIRAAELKGMLENVRPTAEQAEKGLDLLASICGWSPEQLAAEKLKLTFVAPPVQAHTAPDTLVVNATMQAPIALPPAHAKT